VPAAGDQAAVGRFFGPFRIDMDKLRVVAPRELEDFRLAYGAFPKLYCFSNREIFKVTICHRVSS